MNYSFAPKNGLQIPEEPKTSDHGPKQISVDMSAIKELQNDRKSLFELMQKLPPIQRPQWQTSNITSNIVKPTCNGLQIEPLNCQPGDVLQNLQTGEVFAWFPGMVIKTEHVNIGSTFEQHYPRTGEDTSDGS
jgi:hypothetical protein